MSRFIADSNRSPIGAAAGDHGAEDERLPDRQVVLLVEGHERDEDRRRRPRDEPLPGLARRDDRGELVPAEEASGEVRQRVVPPNTQDHGDRDETSVSGKVAHENQMPEPEADPGDAEHRRADGDRGRLPRLGDPFQQERERERRQEAAGQPVDPAELRAEEREQRADVPRGQEGPQLARDRVELVQGDHAGDRREPEQPPAAQPDEAEHDRDAGQADDDSGDEGIHRPPKFLRR